MDQIEKSQRSLSKNKPIFQCIYQFFSAVWIFLLGGPIHTAFSIEQGSMTGKAEKLQLSTEEAGKWEIPSEKPPLCPT